MKKITLFIITIILTMCASAQSYVNYPSYYIDGIYELSPYGEYSFNGRRYKKFKLPINEGIDCNLGKKLASKIYQVVDPEGDDLDIIIVFRDEPPSRVANSDGIICYTIGSVSAPDGYVTDNPTYTFSFIKWYWWRD